MSNQAIGMRLALVGCGAIAQADARALAVTSGASCTALFDVDSARAELLRKVYCPAAEVVRTISEIAERADAAIVAVPNAYHAPISKTLLRAGVHVLCTQRVAA